MGERDSVLAGVLAALETAPELRGWQLERELGRGGMGVVFAARDPTGEPRAVKVMLPEADADDLARRLFEREVGIAVQLRHANIVEADRWGSIGDGYFLAMELCTDGDLYGLIRDGGPLEPVDAVAVAIAVLDALTYAHSVELEGGAHGIVHRDLKPQNILFTRAGSSRVVRVGDFGLAKAFETAGLSGITNTGAKGGTPAFMPRRQVLNYKYAAPDVDVWAAAASLYFALSGQVPRDFEDGRDPYKTIVHHPPVALAERHPGLPARLCEVVDAALVDTGQPAYPSATALRDALRGSLR